MSKSTALLKPALLGLVALLVVLGIGLGIWYLTQPKSANNLSTPEIAEKVIPSTVMVDVVGGIEKFVYSSRNVPRLEDNPYTGGRGTGFLINDGYIITNSHVVEGASQVKVRTGEKADLKNVEIIGISPCDDVALLHIRPEDERNLNIKPAILGDSDVLKVGEDVVAIGYPESYRFGTSPSVTQGVISQLNSMAPGFALKDLIRTDTTLNHGNSGGPLVNRQGQVIGINTLGFSAWDISNMNFAVNMNSANRVAEKLKAVREKGGTGIRWLGMSLDEIYDWRNDSLLPYYLYYYGYDVNNFPSDGFLFVKAVHDGSPASKLGIKAGDVIRQLRNDSVNTTAEICEILDTAGEGSIIGIQIQRRVDNELQTWNGEIVVSDTSKSGKALEEDVNLRQTIEEPAGSENSGASNASQEQSQSEAVNIANQATVTASSEYPKQDKPDCYKASKAIDQESRGDPELACSEWASDHEREGAWIQLELPEERDIIGIGLVDRPNEKDHILAGRIEFSDRSYYDFDALDDKGKVLTIEFKTAIRTKFVKIIVTKVSDSTVNVGLAEIGIFELRK